MNTMQDFRTASLDVREAFLRISDAEVDHDPELAQMLHELELAKAAWHATIPAFDKVRFAVDALPARVAQAEADAEAAERERPAAIAAALLAGEQGFAADDALLKRRDAARLLAERLRLSQAPMRDEMLRLNAAVAEACRPVQSLEDDIVARRTKLKFELARQRAT